MKKIIAICLIFSGLIFGLNASADEVATIYSDKIKLNDKEQELNINIKNNPGIMGFKLSFEYSSEDIQIISVNKGEITQKGNLVDNIGTNRTKFDVLWNNTEQVKKDGVLFKLKIKLLTNSDFKISVYYGQPDTFNEKYNDVYFDCTPIVTENYQDKENKTNKIENSTVEEILVSDNIYSLEDLSSHQKQAVINKLNKQNNCNYKNFSEFKEEYTKQLENDLLNDIDKLNNNCNPKEIISNYLKENKFDSINESNSKELIQALEKEGLKKSYSMYLDKGTLSKKLNIYMKSDKAGVDNYIIILSIVFAIVAFAILVFFIQRRRKRKYEN